MLKPVNERLLSRVLAHGAAFTTIFVVSGSVTDPVNVPKLFSLGIMATAGLGILLADSATRNIKSSKLLWVVCSLFVGFSLISVLRSDSPLSQGMYGAYGRNNGFLAYLFLVFVLLASASFSRIESFNALIRAFFVAGIINIVYCLWVITFGDFIGWNNPYGNILGTLGNPNFIGAFLGMFISAYVAYGISSNSSKLFKFSMIPVLPVTAFEIVDSHAIQGRVVGAAGVAIVGFLYIRSRFNSAFLAIYSAFSLILGFIALLGALQIGPLTAIIYKTSVSLRGQYWLAGWNTGTSHPFSGVGMDAFGDWYRRTRDFHALELPGVNTVVNASHNVPIDMFAFGGWPLFISYLVIMAIGAVSLLRTIKRTQQFDPVLAVLAASWVGYQLQSIISINQIGLATWGWLLTGAAIAYERTTRTERREPKDTNRKVSGNPTQNSKTVLFSAAFGLAGLLLALPPFVSDAKWRSAQLSRSVQNIEATMMTTYFNPQTSTRFISNVQALEQSNLPDLAHKYAVQGVAWNPESFDLWKILYFIKNSTPEERNQALKNMKRLDPLNPDVTSIK